MTPMQQFLREKDGRERSAKRNLAVRLALPLKTCPTCGHYVLRDPVTGLLIRHRICNREQRKAYKLQWELRR